MSGIVVSRGAYDEISLATSRRRPAVATLIAILPRNMATSTTSPVRRPADRDFYSIMAGHSVDDVTI